MESLKYYYHPR